MICTSLDLQVEHITLMEECGYDREGGYEEVDDHKEYEACLIAYVHSISQLLPIQAS